MRARAKRCARPIKEFCKDLGLGTKLPAATFLRHVGEFSNVDVGDFWDFLFSPGFEILISPLGSKHIKK